MEVFGANKRNNNIRVWGPTASTVVQVSALGSVVEQSWVLTNMSVSAREIVDVRQCFNDVSYIYALGHDQRQCSLTLTFAITLGSCSSGGQNSSGGTVPIYDGFNSYVGNRISQKPSATTVTIGKFACHGWLIGLDVGSLDPARGICSGTAHFIIELPAKG